jgi:hypothetical protein
MDAMDHTHFPEWIPNGAVAGAALATRPLRPVPAPPRVPLEDAVVAGPWPMPWAPTACGHARQLVRHVLTRWGIAETACTAELLVSELVSNALRHACRPLHLTLERVSGVRCIVSDGCPAPPRHTAPGPEDEHGRGLELVDMLATRWGWDRGSIGKSVWCELPAHPGDASEVA